MSVVNILDNDLYKFIMHQFIFEEHPGVYVEWEVTNRTETLKLGDEIDLQALDYELKRISQFKFDDELIAILDNAKPGFFTEDYLNYLKNDFSLSPYNLVSHPVDGQIDLMFCGSWLQTSLWECMALATISEMRSVANGRMTEDAIEIMSREFSQKATMIENYNKLYKTKINISEFGTRRRHSFIWQQQIHRYTNIFSSTSNVWLSHLLNIPCVGTYAHEIPMVVTALANTFDIFNAQYEYPAYLARKYGTTLVLPDTYGSTQFFERFPAHPNDINHIGPWQVTDIRIDSKDPIEAGNEAIQFWEDHSFDLREKALLFSDGLSVPDIMYLDQYFSKKRVQTKFGWGTDVTNGTFGTPSLVCKVVWTENAPCIKLSDKYSKATESSRTRIYYDYFGTKGMS